MARKNLLTGLTEPRLTAVNPDALPRPKPLAGKGAFGAVTRTIDELAARADTARVLEARIGAGELIIELDPGQVDASFMSDRMAADDAAYRLLRDAVRDQGQAAPILVRPLQQAPGGPPRYQVAFGHRRLRVAAELGRPVRAIVRTLSDRELVIAQGQENAARSDLSFIERAQFARKLEEAGYDRETIMAALNVDKTTVSRWISIAARVPADILAAIGPAPETGRERWLGLVELLATPDDAMRAEAVLRSAAFAAAESDRRFAIVRDAARSPATQPEPERLRARGRSTVWATKNGTRVARVARNARAFVLTIDQRVAPDFGDFLVSELDRLYAAYSKNR